MNINFSLYKLYSGFRHARSVTGFLSLQPQPKNAKEVSLENRLAISERRRSELVEQKRFLASHIDPGLDRQRRKMSAIENFR